MTDLNLIPTPSRRVVLTTAGAGAIALCLGGCAPAGQPTTTSAPTGATVPVADVPVGAGVILDSYVVTQPTEGTFVAFTRQCTHQGLPIQQVTDAAIVCGHHGSTFSLADGSVITGPATKDLPEVSVTRDGDTLTIG